MFDPEDKGNAILLTSRNHFPIEAPTKRAENVRERQTEKEKNKKVKSKGRAEEPTARVPKMAHKHFLGTRHLLLPQYLYVFCPTIVSILCTMCVYIYTYLCTDCI